MFRSECCLLGNCKKFDENIVYFHYCYFVSYLIPRRVTELFAPTGLANRQNPKRSPKLKKKAPWCAQKLFHLFSFCVSVFCVCLFVCLSFCVGKLRFYATTLSHFRPIIFLNIFTYLFLNSKIFLNCYFMILFSQYLFSSKLLWCHFWAIR